jgi:hypothetical protein
VLLLFERNVSHTKNIDLVGLAREKDVVSLCFPQHCTHELQTLGIAFLKPLRKHYEDSVRKCLRSHPGRVVSLFQIASLFGAAYLQTAMMLAAINGFRRRGVWPVDMIVFTEVDYLKDDATNIRISASTAQLPTNDKFNPGFSSVQDNSSAAGALPAAPEAPPTAAGTSRVPNLCPQDIVLLPKVSQVKERVSRQREKTESLTSPPYRAELRPMGQHDLHTPQRPQVTVHDRMKTTSISAVAMCIRSELKDGFNVRLA